MNQPIPALLTPVPSMHLDCGLKVCNQKGRVAFGSRAWELLEDLDARCSEGMPVLIYRSYEHATKPLITWRAEYLRYVRSRGGHHPERMAVRPGTCKSEDDERFWPGFYEVTGLRELPETEWLSTGSLLDQNGEPYQKPFVPEGPIRVNLPS